MKKTIFLTTFFCNIIAFTNASLACPESHNSSKNCTLKNSIKTENSGTKFNNTLSMSNYIFSSKDNAEAYQRLILKEHKKNDYKSRINKARNNCPVITDIYLSIFNRIIEANNLNNFNIKNKVEIDIKCTNSELFQVDPHAWLNQVVIPSYLVMAAENYDQLALIIAHEIAHVVLEHTKETIDLTLELNKSGITQFSKDYEKVILPYAIIHEAEADEMAIILIANAGFNPIESLDAYFNQMKFLFNDSFSIDSDIISNLWFRINMKSVDKPPHGSINERIERMKNVINNIEYTKLTSEKYNLNNAQKEYLQNSD
ncbi:MAG: M48 family metalloprotease [Bdellovibrionales bacterium]|nr:M48 family metalloprotease [Bdellovibrionales bacterium]